MKFDMEWNFFSSVVAKFNLESVSGICGNKPRKKGSVISWKR